MQAANDAPAHLQVDGALITLATGTLLLQAQDSQALKVQVISGSADLSANGQTVTAATGVVAQVALDGLQASAAPELQNRYAFALLVNTPLDLLAGDNLACIAGVSSGTAALYQTPGGQSAGTLDTSSNLTVTGQTTVDGTPYWLVDGDQWVAQSDVSTAGACGSISQVSPTAGQQQISQPASSLVPSGRSIWTGETSADSLSGTCLGPPIAQCNIQAALTLETNGTLTWRVTNDPAVYSLHSTGANSFSYSGPNQGQGASTSAHVTINVTFTSATTWVATEQIVYDNDTGCTHSFNYSAERIR